MHTGGGGDCIEVVTPRKIGIEDWSFDDSTNTAENSWEMIGVVQTKNVCPSGSWTNQAKQHTDGRRFTRAVGAEKPEDIPTYYLQLQVIDGHQVPKRFGQPACAD